MKVRLHFAALLTLAVSSAAQCATATAQVVPTQPKTGTTPATGPAAPPTVASPGPGVRVTPAAGTASPGPAASSGPRPGASASPSPVPSPSSGPGFGGGMSPAAGAPRFGAARAQRSGQSGPFQEVRTLPRPVVFAGVSVETAENAAVAISPDVAGARARLLQSQYALAAARSGIAPSFITNYAQVPQGNPPGPNIISRQVTAGIQVAVGDFVAYSPAVREAAFTLASAQADLAAAVAAERVKVVGLYFDALKARAVALARRDALSLAGSQLRAAQVRANSGEAPQLDVVRAEVAAAKATADVETATAADLNAREALGIEATTSDEVLGATMPTQFVAVNPKLTDPQAVIALARAMRPELISARNAANAARAAIRSARAAAFPLLTVSGGYLVGTDSDVPINAPTINAQLTIPLSSANRDRIKVAEARALEAQTKAAATERQIVLDVAASARILGAADRAAIATTRARQAAETEIRATEIGYRNGASSSFEVTFARLSFSQAVVDELSALYDLEKARATLDIEVGR